MRNRGSIALVVMMPMLLDCTPTEQAQRDCLGRASVMQLDGLQPRFGWDAATVIPGGSGIDARDAVWTDASAGSYPVGIRRFDGSLRGDVCLVGGRIETSHPIDAPWSFWHDTTALVVETPDFELIKTRFHNVGDGVDLEGIHALRATLRGVHMTHVHDDCVENDEMNSALIDDSLFDGCHVGFSARGWDGHLHDAGDNRMVITNSLVRLQPSQPMLPTDGPIPGHGGFFKFSSSPDRGRSPRLAIHDTIFRADQAPNYYSLGIPSFDHDGLASTPPISYLDEDDCSNNTIVWLGAGDFPDRDEVPQSCFTITTDRAVWDAAVARWQAAHPGA